MKYHSFHERSQAAWEAQRARLAEAVALTERQATEGELRAAADVPDAVDAESNEGKE